MTSMTSSRTGQDVGIYIWLMGLYMELFQLLVLLSVYSLSGYLVYY